MNKIMHFTENTEVWLWQMKNVHMSIDSVINTSVEFLPCHAVKVDIRQEQLDKERCVKTWSSEDRLR
jgi:hypothetical protein